MLDVVLQRVNQKVIEEKATLTSSFTAQFWLQYIMMADLLLQFIKEERIGNWSLYLHTLEEILPFFAAAGHNHHAEFVYIHLQQMHQL